MKKIIISLLSAAALSLSLAQAQVVLTGNYTQDFNLIGSGLPTGWSVRTGANATLLGTDVTSTNFNSNHTSWNTTTGQFANYASYGGLDNSSESNRALGIRQTASFGDPGASFNFYFNTATNNLQVTQIQIDLMILSNQTRSTTWTIQYGIGATPSSFTDLGTYSDPGSVSRTTFTFTTGNFGTNLDNQSDVWFRVVALSSSTGSGNRDTFAIDNFSITAIPEPTTWALLSLGGTAFVLFRRRQA